MLNQDKSSHKIGSVLSKFILSLLSNSDKQINNQPENFETNMEAIRLIDRQMHESLSSFLNKENKKQSNKTRQIIQLRKNNKIINEFESHLIALSKKIQCQEIYCEEDIQKMFKKMSEFLVLQQNINKLWSTIKNCQAFNFSNCSRFIKTFLKSVPDYSKLFLDSLQICLLWDLFRRQLWLFCSKQQVLNPQSQCVRQIKKSFYQMNILQKNTELADQNQQIFELITCYLNDLQDIEEVLQGFSFQEEISQIKISNDMLPAERTPEEIKQFIEKEIPIIYENIVQSPYSSQKNKQLYFSRISHAISVALEYSKELPISTVQKLENLRVKCVRELSQVLGPLWKKQTSDPRQSKILIKRMKYLYHPLLPQLSNLSDEQDLIINQLKYELNTIIFKMEHRLNFDNTSEANQLIILLQQNEASSLYLHQTIIYLIQSFKCQKQVLNFPQLFKKIIDLYCYSHPNWFNFKPSKNRDFYEHPRLSTCSSQECFKNIHLPQHLWNFIELAIKLYCCSQQQSQINLLSQRVLEQFYMLHQKQFLSVSFSVMASKYYSYSPERENKKFRKLLKQFVLERGHCLSRVGELFRLVLNNCKIEEDKIKILLSPQFYIHLNQPIIKSHNVDHIMITFDEVTVHNPNLQPISHSSFYRNHWSDFIYGRCLVKCCQFLQQNLLNYQYDYIFKIIQTNMVDLVDWLKKVKSNITHNSQQFYRCFRAYKYLYIFIQLALKIWERDNKYIKAKQLIIGLIQLLKEGNIHPLIRQFMCVVIGKIYLSCPEITREYRQIFIEEMIANKIDLNTYVPIILILGLQMIQKSQSRIKTQEEIASRIFNKFIEFISCHHAYVRSIAQYYVSKYIENEKNKIQETNFGFLEYLCFRVWKFDKDCIKIMKNIGIVVEGFKKAMEHKGVFDYLGFERVQQFPTQEVMSQLNSDCKLTFNTILTQEKIKTCFQIHQIAQQSDKKAILCNGLQLRYRRPDIIIIASLLQKVHNFGHILRTMHNVPGDENQFGLNILLVVPSKQPLEHPECLELIPNNSQVHIIDIKPEDLTGFVTIFKKEYPLIALEQCSNSVQIQTFKFPKNYMLLLGNQRIGAPAALLNQADYLLEIPQIGKVRSLNVHVSMAICIWNGITSNSV